MLQLVIILLILIIRWALSAPRDEPRPPGQVYLVIPAKESTSD